MKKEKKLPQRAAQMNDDIFLAMISAKNDARVKALQLAAAEAKIGLMEAEIKLIEVARLKEQRVARRERNGLAAFTGVVTGLVVTGVCVLAAPVWTAVLPILGTLAVMRKAGWI